MSEAVVTSLITLAGVVIGLLVQPVTAYILRRSESKAEHREQQLAAERALVTEFLEDLMKASEMEAASLLRSQKKNDGEAYTSALHKTADMLRDKTGTAIVLSAQVDNSSVCELVLDGYRDTYEYFATKADRHSGEPVETTPEPPCGEEIVRKWREKSTVTRSTPRRLNGDGGIVKGPVLRIEWRRFEMAANNDKKQKWLLIAATLVRVGLLVSLAMLAATMFLTWHSLDTLHLDANRCLGAACPAQELASEVNEGMPNFKILWLVGSVLSFVFSVILVWCPWLKEPIRWLPRTRLVSQWVLGISLVAVLSASGLGVVDSLQPIMQMPGGIGLGLGLISSGALQLIRLRLNDDGTLS